MKAKGALKFKICMCIVALISVMIIFGAVILSKYSYFDSVNAITTFAIGILSLLISIIALLVALSTYFSIDSVNVISSMEGNILCNENYNAEYRILVGEYNECRTQAELEENLYKMLYKSLKKKSSTCMQFTDRIQDILDHILWYAYVDTNEKRCKKHVKKIVKILNKRYEAFSSISNGNQYVLKEHIKLIMNVLNYQSVTKEGSISNPEGEMLNIRGRMFINPVSKTVYYDYLGLEYHKMAIAFLRKITGFEGEVFLQENMKKLKAHIYTEEEKDELEIYLTKAKEAFEVAMISSTDDILWKGYISFNKARIDLLTFIVNNNYEPGWDESIRAAIVARYAVMKLFTPKEEKSFLHLQFEREYYYAKSLYLCMKAYLNTEIDDVKKEVEDIQRQIPDLDDVNGKICNRIRLYTKDVLNSILDDKGK